MKFTEHVDAVPGRGVQAACSSSATLYLPDTRAAGRPIMMRFSLPDSGSRSRWGGLRAPLIRLPAPAQPDRTSPPVRLGDKQLAALPVEQGIA